MGDDVQYYPLFITINKFITVHHTVPYFLQTHLLPPGSSAAPTQPFPAAVTTDVPW